MLCRLEVFNAVIFYHLPENPNLSYAILRSHKTFEDLGTFNLARGLREVRRIQKAKDEQASRADRKGKNREVDEQQPHEEKQRLLEREGSTLSDSFTDLRVDSRPSSPPDEQHPASSEEQVAAAQPLMSPSIDTPMTSAYPVSEKARGKMKARRSGSLDTNASQADPASVGRNGFIPTQEWVTSWQQGYGFVISFCRWIQLMTSFSLPLDPAMILISEFMPKLQDVQGHGTSASSKSIMDLLSRASLTHALPSPPPLNPRRFIVSSYVIYW